MIDLLHADLYRLIHGRKFWVGCVVLILCSVGLLGGVITFLSGYDGPVDADITEVLTRTLPSHSAMLTYSSMFRGGLVSGVVSLVVALAVSEDRDSGLAKNLFSSGVGRGRYAVEKLLLATLLSLWYALLSIVTLEITFAALGFDYASAEPVIGWLGFVVVLVLGRGLCHHRRDGRVGHRQRGLFECRGRRRRLSAGRWCIDRSGRHGAADRMAPTPGGVAADQQYEHAHRCPVDDGRDTARSGTVVPDRHGRPGHAGVGARHGVLRRLAGAVLGGDAAGRPPAGSMLTPGHIHENGTGIWDG